MQRQQIQTYQSIGYFCVKLYESKAEIIHEMFYERSLYQYYCFLFFLNHCSWEQYNLERHGVYYFVADTILAFLFVLSDIYFIIVWLYHFRCTDVNDVRIDIQQNYFELLDEPPVQLFIMLTLGMQMSTPFILVFMNYSHAQLVLLVI